MNLNTATAIVTGASRRLGAALARTLSKEGITVYGMARSGDKLDDIQKEVGSPFIPTVLDITDYEAVREWIGRQFSETEGPDILINNAGTAKFSQVEDLSTDQWQRMIDTNLSAVFNVTREVVPKMKTSDTASYIINIGSILGMLGNPEMSAYCATKFGLRGFSEALFKELRYDGIKVTCLHPGSIETDLFADSGIESHANMLQPSDVADTVLHLLKTPNNMLINELTIRPLNPKKPD